MAIRRHVVASDADPDVKRMALEAGDKVNINQIYSAGASKQQWDAFVQGTRNKNNQNHA
jgi:hypothetical protein